MPTGAISTRRSLGGAVLLLVGLLAAGVARAQTPPPGPQLQLITRGNAAFREGQFAVALELYQQARVHGETPELLFNLGQCHRKLGQKPEAIRLFRAYLGRYPEAPNRGVVERLLSRLGASPDEDPLDPARPRARPRVGARSGHPGCWRHR